MKVFIYKPDKTTFQDDWLFAADMGFKQLGAKIIYFDNINSIPYAPDNVVVAYVEDTRDYFDLHDVKYPLPLNIPVELGRDSVWMGRKYRDVFPAYKVMEMKGPLFIKPAMKVKEFSAGVIKDPSKLELLGIPKESIVFYSEVLDFISEYRCFVYNNELVAIKHYQGDIRRFPHISKVESMIQGYINAPIAYSLDVGIVSDTYYSYLIECNDFWSIGSYGLDPLIYAKMLRDRWFELTGFRNVDRNK